jgi:hypothetical protein
MMKIPAFTLAFALLLMYACTPTNSSDDDTSTIVVQRDTSITILQKNWLDDRSGWVLEINQDYIKEIKASERAALAYVFTFLEMNCDRDFLIKEGARYADCELAEKLGLMPQCGPVHKKLLEDWFASDTALMESANHCPIIPIIGKLNGQLVSLDITWKKNQLEICYQALFHHLKDEKTREIKARILFETGDFGLRILEEEPLKTNNENWNEEISLL